jgi:hypothetical protein
MNTNKLTTAVLVFFLLFGVFLIGNGFTGMVISGPYVKHICETDNDCISPEVCCLFYEQDVGVCHDKDLCDDVEEITKIEKVGTERDLKIFEEKPSYTSDFFYMQMVIGVLMIAISLALLFYHFKLEHPYKKRKK